MHDVLRQRLMRSIESLPDDQVYQVLDFIEFLESKYARDLKLERSGLQKIAEALEDKMRKKAMNPATLREAFQLISAADRVMSSVSSAGKQIISDLGSLADLPEGERGESDAVTEEADSTHPSMAEEVGDDPVDDGVESSERP